MFKRYNFENHHRQSIRLPKYDYSRPGIYFVTICCHQKQHIFGEIKNGITYLSPIGCISKKYFLKIPQYFPNVQLDQWVIMPNHVHDLIKIINHSQNVGAQHVVPLRSQNKFQCIIPGSLGVIIRHYKSNVTKWCRKNHFGYCIWQRNYHEHIIRNDADLNRIREYIKNNPLNWQNDRNNLQ